MLVRNNQNNGHKIEGLVREIIKKKVDLSK